MMVKFEGMILAKFILIIVYVFTVILVNAEECTRTQYSAFVTDVYDADTITVDISLGMHLILQKEKVRLYGINAPEMTGTERNSGTISRDWLRNQILHKHIIVETIEGDKTGKYGRLLGIIYIDGRNINMELVEKGYAKLQNY